MHIKPRVSNTVKSLPTPGCEEYVDGCSQFFPSTSRLLQSQTGAYSVAIVISRLLKQSTH